MSRPLAFLAVALFAVGFGSASAQSVSTATDVQADTAPVAVDAQAGAQAQAGVAPDQDANQPPAGCVKETGTNIRQRDPKTGKPLCMGPGRSYSREQIERTGQTDLADALRRLDPSIR